MLIASPKDSLESHSRTVQFQLFNNSLRTLVRFGRSFTNLYCLVLRALVLLTSADMLPSHPGNPFCSQPYVGKINSGIICLPVICWNSSNEKFKHHQQDLSFEITPDDLSSLGNQIYFAIDEIQPSKNLKG